MGVWSIIVSSLLGDNSAAGAESEPIAVVVRELHPLGDIKYCCMAGLLVETWGKFEPLLFFLPVLGSEAPCLAREDPARRSPSAGVEKDAGKSIPVT